MDDANFSYLNLTLDEWNNLTSAQKQHFFRLWFGNSSTLSEETDDYTFNSTKTTVLITFIALTTVVAAILIVYHVTWLLLTLCCGRCAEKHLHTRQHRPHLALHVTSCVTWGVFLFLCVPFIIVHDLLSRDWQFGDVTCKLIPQLASTAKLSQPLLFNIMCATHLLTSLRPDWIIARVMTSKLACVLLPLLVSSVATLASLPVMHQFTVVKFANDATPYCVNIASVMTPSHNFDVKLHYFLWLTLAPVLVCVVTSLVHLVSTRRSNNAYVQLTELQSDRQKSATSFTFYLLLQCFAFMLLWFPIDIVEIIFATKHAGSWIEPNSSFHDVARVLAYSYPLTFTLISLAFYKALPKTTRSLDGFARVRSDSALASTISHDALVEASHVVKVLYDDDGSSSNAEMSVLRDFINK